MLKNASLLITTYNWPEALSMAVTSVWNQTILPKEIIIADDGSGEPTRQCISQLQKQSPIPLIHVWQEDNGFQAAQIRNKGIAAANNDYIICTDGDMLLESHFIEDHLFYAQHGFCVCGKRAKLTPKASQRILEEQKFNNPGVISPQIKFGYNFYALRSRWLCNRFIYTISDFRLRPRVMSCNMAFWKEDAIKINGFDQAYTTWGLEDRDFALRLRHAGIALKCIRFNANEFHLHHNTRIGNVNTEQYQQCALEKRIRAQKGIDQYLP